MDVMKRVTDLMNMALDGASTDSEKLTCAIGALRLIRQYELLGKKRINVAVDILDKFTSADFVEGVVSRAEKIADGFSRVMGSAKRVRDITGVGDATKRRRYGSDRGRR
jgi:hypothetical protein